MRYRDYNQRRMSFRPRVFRTFRGPTTPMGNVRRRVIVQRRPFTARARMANRRMLQNQHMGIGLSRRAGLRRIRQGPHY